MYLVTGGAGFIGSRLINHLNNLGITDIIVVDDLTEGKKFYNLSRNRIHDYFDKEDFIERVKTENLPYRFTKIFHLGACSATTEWDGRYMMLNNYEYSKVLFTFASKEGIPFYYASSAATYGMTTTFKEEPEFENPLNVYGYSKLQFDNFVRRSTSKNQVVGFRFFNVYGLGEEHKGSMASVAYHHYTQLLAGNSAKLFGAYENYDPGEQLRDFVYVEDVVRCMHWFSENPEISGIFNLGTGRSEPFNNIANSVIQTLGKGGVEYVEFPEHLKGVYQAYTQADLKNLRAAGYSEKFMSVTEGVSDYIERLETGSWK